MLVSRVSSGWRTGYSTLTCTVSLGKAGRWNGPLCAVIEPPGKPLSEGAAAGLCPVSCNLGVTIPAALVGTWAGQERHQNRRVG